MKKLRFPIKTKLSAETIRRGNAALQQSNVEINDELFTHQSGPRNPEEILIGRGLCSELSKEARTMARIIFSAPYEYIESVTKITKYFREDLGWTARKVEKGIRDLKKFVKG